MNFCFSSYNSTFVISFKKNSFFFCIHLQLFEAQQQQLWVFYNALKPIRCACHGYTVKNPVVTTPRRIDHLRWHNLRGVLGITVARQDPGLAQAQNSHLGVHHHGGQVSATNIANVRKGNGTASKYLRRQIGPSWQPLGDVPIRGQFR